MIERAEIEEVKAAAEPIAEAAPVAGMPKRKYSIWKYGEVPPHKEFSKRTICHVHRVLAHLIWQTDIEESRKHEILELVDEVYDMGRRMGEKLRDYHQEFVDMGLKKKGWRDEF